MADFEDHVVIFSILFLCFPFLSRCSRLKQSLLLMRTTQISKAVLSTMMLISCRRQSVLHRRRMNRPRAWVYPRDQQWFGEIHRNPSMHGFFRGHFRMSFDSFQTLCRILASYSEAYAGVFAHRTTFHTQTVMIDTFYEKANVRC